MSERLELKLSLDQTNLLPGTTNRCHVVAEITAGAVGVGGTRPPLTMVLALDTSASMKGPPLENLMLSVQRLVDLLTPDDRVGIVTFSTGADMIMPVSAATEQTKAEVHGLVARLSASHQTNMEAGLSLAAEMLHQESEFQRRAIFLLSDGVPNIGLCTPLTLGERAANLREMLSIWSLGYGPHHQEDILGSVSDAAGGRYQYIPEPEICEFMFAKALGIQGAIVAEAVELRLTPHAGAQINRFLGRYKTREENGSFVVSLPDFLAETRHLVVGELSVRPSREQGLWKAVSAELSYRVPGEPSRSVHDQHIAPVMVASTSSQIVPEARVGVLLARCDQVRDEAHALADKGQFQEAVEKIEGLETQLLDWPGFEEGDGSQLSIALEILRDEKMALEAEPTLQQYRAYRRGQMNVSLTGESFSASWTSVENEYGDSVVRAVAGEYPAAEIRQIIGVETGRTISLRAEQTIGRSQDVDVSVASDRVSRAHAVIVAQRGRFFVMDLGSANGTWVNGLRVQTKSLNDGDVINLASDVAFRYSELKTERRMVVLTEEGETFVVERDRLFVIGRSRACTLALADEAVARRHAAVHVENGRYFLEVYAGATPVVRDGKTLSRVEIRDGDRIQIGETNIRFELR